MHAVARDSLAGALGLGTREVLSLVVAGGKTTALHRLGRELAAGGSRVVASTTTAMFLSQMAVVRPVLMETGRTELVPRLRRALLSGRAAAVARRVRGGEGRMKAAEPFATTAGLAENGTPFVLLTVTDVKGSTPRGVGAKMLVLGDGTTVETIGGGVLERRASPTRKAILPRGNRAQRRTSCAPKETVPWVACAAVRSPSSLSRTCPVAPCSSSERGTWGKSCVPAPACLTKGSWSSIRGPTWSLRSAFPRPTGSYAAIRPAPQNCAKSEKTRTRSS